MSTLVEIENAVVSLPTAQQEDLLLWLKSRLERAPLAAAGKAGAWVRQARGSVRHAEGRSADELRMEHYAAKHGLNP